MNRINLVYTGYTNREGLYDLFESEMHSDVLTVFVHGYMGYKDWGAWNLMCEELAFRGYTVAKLNLTSNGTTLDKPTEFADLERFGNGGYFQELSDVRLFLDHLQKEHGYSKFRLMGHSRGGGIVLLAGLDTRVTEIHCLAPISSIENRFPKGEELEKWNIDGVYYRKNGRTGQEMPHYFCQYEEFLKYQDELNIEQVCKQLNKPVFVYHGENDVSVLPIEGELVAKWTNGRFYLIKDTAHTFDTSEPWLNNTMPDKLLEVLDLNF
ncbi:MAG TPA: alpha/beta hydrolase [Taishania sp.]|nr:alpha/beta hydrolase [Taishania sp.]